ncbi:hypothetical protein GPROT1_02304 [Gammaproteobacteria bacterium]|nr:hypothetical protein GPROT1_02304 [Gammaproteobacteria bacterium]
MDEQNEQTKICPDCGAEFYAYVKECSRCLSELVPAEEIRGTSKPSAPKHPSDGLVCIEDGSYERANELAWALREKGFDATVLRAPAASCGGGFGVFVEQGIARDAALYRDELLKKLNGGLEEAEAKLRAGICPACGAALMGSSEECPDCGLFVGVSDDCEGDGSCGSCGH